MARFFDYRSPYRTDYYLEFSKFEINLTLVEKIIPFIVLLFLGIILYIYKDKIRNNEVIDKRIRLNVGILFTILFLSHFILRFTIYGFDTIVLPFQLCAISMILAIILLFTKNRTVFAFVYYAGLAGALISFSTPLIGANSSYYRYYQFYIAHGILILTPIYFLLVHKYIPNLKETIKAFGILQGLATFMVLFNYMMNTDFMFVFIDKAKIDKFPGIAQFGGIPLYLIWVEIAGISLFAIMYMITKKLSGGGTNEIN